MTVTYRHLPHWEQQGVCAFVTIRLGDSLPASVHNTYKALRRRWLEIQGLSEGLSTKEMMERLTESEALRFQRLASKLYEGALDKGAGECLFRYPIVRLLLMEVLKEGEERFFSLGAGVIMPNHVHVLIQPNEEESLSKILSSIRRVSARRINRHLGREGELWQPEPFDHLIRSRGKYKKFARYIQCNPVRAGLRSGEYTFWE